MRMINDTYNIHFRQETNEQQSVFINTQEENQKQNQKQKNRQICNLQANLSQNDKMVHIETFLKIKSVQEIRTIST